MTDGGTGDTPSASRSKTVLAACVVGGAVVIALAWALAGGEEVGAPVTVSPGDETPDPGGEGPAAADPGPTGPADTATIDPDEPDPTRPDPGGAVDDPPAPTVPPETDPLDERPPGWLPDPPPVALPPIDQLASVAVQVEPVLDIARLTAMEWNVFESSYYAVTQDGFVHRIPEDLASSEVVLDLSGEVTEWLPGSERGLLGITFDPADGRMFLHFTDQGNDSHVVWYEMSDGRPVPDSRRQVVFVEQPGLGHQGGRMEFDAAGHLFIAFGDGGGSRGRDAQDGEVLHGSIVRIVPDAAGEGYEIPDDNPFVGDPEWRDELWVVGLRNPWRFSIDPASGDMWIGDVGEDTLEAVYLVPGGTSGQNFGWYWFEGSRHRGIGGMPDDLEVTPPVHEYERSVGVAVIGGNVYHGSRIAGLTGAYVFADMSGPLFALGDGGVARLDARVGGVVTGFAETPERELLVLTLQNGLYRVVPG